MASTIGWLDTTAEQQRLAREMVSLFMISESRDELGIGQIRDVMSNWMFPGTSTLHARARYFVLVPWCHRVAEIRAHRHGRDLAQQIRKVQLDMIETMRRDHPDADGLIGKQAGRQLKGLPRDLFWTGLVTYGIRLSETDLPDQRRPDEGEESELVTRPITSWDPDLPSMPAGFPGTVPGGLDMSALEAQWLAERMRTNREDTYLAHLLTVDPTEISAAHAPWEVDQSSQFASVRHGHHFSVTMEGASLLYNLLVAERYEAHPDLSRLDGEERASGYRDRLEVWAHQWSAADPTGWDLDEFIYEVTTRNRRVSRRTWDFVRAWLDLLRLERPASIANSDEARRLITHRESRKGAKSRLTDSSKTLESWSGDSGSGALTYRWGTIQTLMRDINCGRGTQDEDHADA